jgi:hypothetical protein
VKKPVFWLALAVAAFVVGAAVLFRRSPPERAPLPEKAVTLPSKSPFAPPPNQAAPPKPKPVVAIEDGKTIDFSSGAAIVKDTAQEKAIIERSVKEMVNALQNVKFEPKAPGSDEKKSAADAKAPAK